MTLLILTMDRIFFYLFLLQIFILHQLKAAQVQRPFWIDDYNDSTIEKNMLELLKHPCRRICQLNEPPMTCSYVFRVEHYYTMSKACFDCPNNFRDCFRDDCIPADGVKRALVVANRQIPGPAIEVCQGDRVIVDVMNLLHADSTTIHWHGQKMRGNPYMDGVPYVSQCPIRPGERFRYNFTAADHGTHFWHSHVGFQRGDGLFGVMIVRQAPELNKQLARYDYDNYNIIITDWDHQMGLSKFLGHYHSDGSNKPPNILINGLGRFGNRTKKEGQSNVIPAATFIVKQNFRYRLRIINAEFLNCPIEMTIDNHTMLIVSSDGRDVEPVEVDSFVSYAGERFDVIVEMNQTVDNYWIKFRGLLDCAPTFTKAYQVAILRYEGAPKEDPQADVGYEIPFLDIVKETKRKPRVANPFNKGTEEDITFISIPRLVALDENSEANQNRTPDHQFYISYDFYGKDNEEFHRKGLYGFNEAKNKVTTPQLNHISMKLPPFPMMSQQDMINSSKFCNASTVQSCERDYCACPHVIQVKLNSVVELVLVDEGVPYDANHPFHLHGHSFRVMAMQRLANSTTAEEVRIDDAAGKIKRRYDRAPIKDTVTVPDGGFTIIRFYANNPGYWLFHCHIEFHVEVGMALVFKVGEHEDFAPIPKDFPRCGKVKRQILINNQTMSVKTNYYEYNYDSDVY